MTHAQKPDLVFQRNGRVHLYRRGCQFSRPLATEVCASAVVMLDKPCSDTVHDCWLPTPFPSFPFISPPVLRRVPSDSVSTFFFLPYEGSGLYQAQSPNFTQPCPYITKQKIIILTPTHKTQLNFSMI